MINLWHDREHQTISCATRHTVLYAALMWHNIKSHHLTLHTTMWHESHCVIPYHTVPYTHNKQQQLSHHTTACHIAICRIAAQTSSRPAVVRTATSAPACIHFDIHKSISFGLLLELQWCHCDPNKYTQLPEWPSHSLSLSQLPWIHAASCIDMAIGVITLDHHMFTNYTGMYTQTTTLMHTVYNLLYVMCSNTDVHSMPCICT